MKSPVGTLSELYKQYIHVLSAIYLSHLFKCGWRKTKNYLTISRLHKQIAKYNKIANRDSCNLYKELLNENKKD